MKIKEEVNTAVVIAAIEKKSGKIINKLTGFKVKTKDDFELAAKLLKELKTFGAEAEKEEEGFWRPLKQLADKVKSHFKPLKDKISAVELETKKEMLAFTLKQDEKLKQLETKLETGEIKKVSTYMNNVAKEKVTATKDVQIRTVKQLEITDLAKIPRKYLVVDETALKNALLAGVVVEGARIINVKTLAV